MAYKPPADIANPLRLAALRRLALLDSPPEPAFDRLTRLAAKILHAPMAFVSLVDADRQFFKSCLGLPEPWASRRETPLAHSFCQHTVATGMPLIIENAHVHPLTHDNPAIHNLGIVAYIGIPLAMSDGHILGSFCISDRIPRVWSTDDIDILGNLAASVMTEIELRSEIAERKQTERERERLIGELQAALVNIKTLRGMLPICASCKKIRDDRGYWNQIETYVRDHSEAVFSHSLCPDCAQRLYPDLIEDGP